ncbi:LAETG motif-containing sortase-dependent surface protein [Streptomyces bungoensis]|uniref:LAETG motif-containing sortase-dependent surface protein n=1 Tax=Streptomyces bungoensis TaxID=285568 RepID=UPI00367FC0A1
MPLSRHAARAARALGTSAAAVALCATAAQTALACSIGDFSAAPACDAQGKGVVRVTDKDPSGTPATVTLYVQLSMPGGQREVDKATIGHPTAQGVSVDLHPLDWYAGETLVVHVTAGGQVDEDITPPVVVPDDFTCEPAGGGASASPSPSAPSAHPSAHPSTPGTQPSPARSSSAAPTPAASGAPSPAGGGTHLAETGAGNGTPLVAGAAAALVLAGGGIVLGLRRKAAHGSR